MRHETVNFLYKDTAITKFNLELRYYDVTFIFLWEATEIRTIMDRYFRDLFIYGEIT